MSISGGGGRHSSSASPARQGSTYGGTRIYPGYSTSPGGGMGLKHKKEINGYENTLNWSSRFSCTLHTKHFSLYSRVNAFYSAFHKCEAMNEICGTAYIHIFVSTHM